ncbi:MAG: hypothetical protein FWG13_05540 [Leptospirales bacterium]|nr:hypothetical protein [Leptospirales bacterium]
MQINFDSGYTMTHKEFTFSGGVSVPLVSGDDCVAVTWRGSLNKTDYYGFAVGMDGFHLILYFPKTVDASKTESYTLDPAPAPGGYIAVMRNGNTIYKNPTSPITLTIEPTGSEGNTKITMTGLGFTSPPLAAISGSMILRPY